MLRLLMIVGTGGFIGTLMRFLLSRYIQEQTTSSFPLGTFIINIAGCFLIGIFYGLAERGNLMSTEWRLFLTVGICGGFTTFSTFSGDNLALLRGSEFLYLGLYAGLSVFLGLLATYLGNTLIKAI